MALRRVMSKTEPRFESEVSDEWIARWPDDWDVIDDTPPAAAATSPEPRPAPSGRPASPYGDDADYR